MYKKLLPALLFSAVSFASYGQISILTGANFNPVIGDKFISANSDTTGINQGSAGASITWNFSSILDSVSSDTGYAVLPSTTIAGSGFTSSTYAVTNGTTGVAAYYFANSSSLTQNGIYTATSGVVYTDPMDVLRYPFTYGSTFTDTYAGTIVVGSTLVPTHGTTTVTCDGYGTLKLPHGNTHPNVLRVHTAQQYIDSANIFGVGVNDTFQVVTYTWYEPGYHTAIMTIATGTSPAGNFKQVSYESKQIAAAVPVVPGIVSSVQVFPNPAHDVLNVQYTTVNTELVHITLVDVLGRVVAAKNSATQGMQNISFNTSSLPKGTYVVRITANEEVITGKIELL